jgi:hypothetical protein
MKERLDLNSAAFLDAVRDNRALFLRGWFFRNAQNCVRHRETVRSYLTPWPRHVDRARAVLQPARRRGRFVVGVHVRRGDYRGVLDGRFYYSHEQYRAIMERVQGVFPDKDVSFLVCSDEAVPTGAFAGLDVMHGNGHELEDLCAFAECDALVGPPSTFTTWASYYGGVPLFAVHDPGDVPSADSFQVGHLEWERLKKD